MSFVKNNNAQLFTFVYREQLAVRKLAALFTDTFSRMDGFQPSVDTSYNLCIVWSSEQKVLDAFKEIGQRYIASEANDGTFIVAEFILADFSSITNRSPSEWVTSIKVSAVMEVAACNNELTRGSSGKTACCEYGPSYQSLLFIADNITCNQILPDFSKSSF